MEYPEKFVEFDKFCENCKYKDVKQDEEPCNECLENPVNEHSIKPIKFEKQETKEKKK